MRKLKLQVQMTIDGFIAGPRGELDWLTSPWTADINNYVAAITDPVDTIVLGRKLAQGFIPHWAKVASQSDSPEYEAGKKFTETNKVVFTKTLDEQEWGNTVLAKGDLSEEINKLKSEDGKDIIAYGGAAFASALIRERLVDEFHFFINPLALGNGMSIFRDLSTKQDLILVNAESFSCGIVVLNYVPNLPPGLNI